MNFINRIFSYFSHLSIFKDEKLKVQGIPIFLDGEDPFESRCEVYVAADSNEIDGPKS